MKPDASIDIELLIDDVFVVTNEHVAKWSTIVIEDERLETKNGGGVGTTFRTVTQQKGKRMVFLGEVIQYEPPTLSVVKMIGEQFDILAEYRFQDIGDGRTRVTQSSTVTPKAWFLNMMFYFLGGVLKSASAEAALKELKGLKAFCERPV